MTYSHIRPLFAFAFVMCVLSFHMLSAEEPETAKPYIVGGRQVFEVRQAPDSDENKPVPEQTYTVTRPKYETREEQMQGANESDPELVRRMNEAKRRFEAAQKLRQLGQELQKYHAENNVVFPASERNSAFHEFLDSAPKAEKVVDGEIDQLYHFLAFKYHQIDDSRGVKRIFTKMSFPAKKRFLMAMLQPTPQPETPEKLAFLESLLDSLNPSVETTAEGVSLPPVEGER